MAPSSADIVQQLSSSDPNQRRAAIDAAVAAGDPRLVGPLRAMIGQDPDPSLRAQALQAVLRLQPDLAADQNFIKAATAMIQQAQPPANPWQPTPNPLPPSPPRPAPTGEKVYEMLWDCRFCGQKKNLGKTHRHCPNCGAAQDPSARYFPSDEEKIAVQDHEFVGADRLCGFCQAPNAAKAKCCTECGAPLDDKKVQGVFVRQDQVGDHFAGESAADAKREKERGAPPAKPVKKGLRWFHYVGIGVAALVTFILVGTFWTKKVGLVVASHHWQRVVHVEQFGPVQDAAWCNQTPTGAYHVRQAREVRSHNRIPDGQDCHNRRHDNGDGTYSERRECTTKYRDEPVYDWRCYFTIDRWHPERDVTAQGAMADAVAWPDAKLQAGTGIGAEREGGRDEKYTVTLRDEKKGTTHDCAFDQPRWQTMRDGSRWTGSAGVVLDDLRCDSLQAQ